MSGVDRNGFTLVELIVVIVVLSIVSVLGAQMIVTATDSYARTESRSKLVQTGRQAIERMTRQLRLALPNALRVSPSANCIEFMQVVAGAHYLNAVPDSNNGAPLTDAVATAPFTLGAGSAAHVAIAPLTDIEVYTTAVPAARVGIGTLGGAPIDTVPLAGNHRFLRNSINRRLFVLDNPARFCVTGGQLRYYSDYGLLSTALTDADPGGGDSLLARDVAAAAPGAFTLSAGTEDRNTIVDIRLRFGESGESIVLNHKVFVRNVP